MGALDLHDKNILKLSGNILNYCFQQLSTIYPSLVSRIGNIINQKEKVRNNDSNVVRNEMNFTAEQLFVFLYSLVFSMMNFNGVGIL
jgi:hypothetical protein